MQHPSRHLMTALLAGLAFTWVVAVPSSAVAQETVTSVRSPLEPALERALGQDLPSMTAGVKKIAIGSTGATVTLAAGDEVLIDLTGLTGAKGGTNYLGLGMLLFGLSVLTRLVSTIGRIIRPFARRREGRWDD